MVCPYVTSGAAAAAQNSSLGVASQLLTAVEAQKVTFSAQTMVFVDAGVTERDSCGACVDSFLKEMLLPSHCPSNPSLNVDIERLLSITGVMNQVEFFVKLILQMDRKVIKELMLVVEFQQLTQLTKVFEMTAQFAAFIQKRSQCESIHIPTSLQVFSDQESLKYDYASESCEEQQWMLELLRKVMPENSGCNVPTPDPHFTEMYTQFILAAQVGTNCNVCDNSQWAQFGNIDQIDQMTSQAQGGADFAWMQDASKQASLVGSLFPACQKSQNILFSSGNVYV